MKIYRKHDSCVTLNVQREFCIQKYGQEDPPPLQFGRKKIYFDTSTLYLQPNYLTDNKFVCMYMYIIAFRLKCMPKPPYATITYGTRPADRHPYQRISVNNNSAS